MGTVYACEQRRAVSAEEENLRGARGNILISDERRKKRQTWLNTSKAGTPTCLENLR